MVNQPNVTLNNLSYREVPPTEENPEGSIEYFVKWKDLTYDACKWEDVNGIILTTTVITVNQYFSVFNCMHKSNISNTRSTHSSNVNKTLSTHHPKQWAKHVLTSKNSLPTHHGLGGS